jgi:hypothetical protein
MTGSIRFRCVNVPGAPSPGEHLSSCPGWGRPPGEHWTLTLQLLWLAQEHRHLYRRDTEMKLSRKLILIKDIP